MSNFRHAYGWCGHILVSDEERNGNEDDNVIAIPDEAFQSIVKAFEENTLDERIQIERLGIEDSSNVILATGTAFSKAFPSYGTVFEEAELRSLPGMRARDLDSEYIEAMKDIYNITLPPSRLMVGCASEH